MNASRTSAESGTSCFRASRAQPARELPAWPSAGERAVKDGSVRSSAVMVCGAADTAARAGCSVGSGSVSSRIICWCSAGPGPDRGGSRINSIHAVERRGAKMRTRTPATHLIAHPRPISAAISAPGSSSFPAEEVPGPDEASDACHGGGGAVFLPIPDVSRAGEIDAIEVCELEEHPGLGLAAVAAVIIRVGTEPPVDKETTELLVRPGEAADDLGHADLALRDAGLIRHDETRIVARALAREHYWHVRHEYRIAGSIDHCPVVFREREGATPVEEEGALRARHRATLSRRRPSSPELRACVADRVNQPFATMTLLCAGRLMTFARRDPALHTGRRLNVCVLEDLDQDLTMKRVATAGRTKIVDDT